MLTLSENGGLLCSPVCVLVLTRITLVLLTPFFSWYSESSLTSTAEEYPLVDIGSVEAKSEGAAIFVLKSPLGSVMLELEASNPRACQNAVISIREAMEELTTDEKSRPLPRRTAQSKVSL